MIYIREEGELIRQGFNFYPLKSCHVGFQFMLGRLRVELRRNKLLKRNAFRVWLREPAQEIKAECIYIPGYTEELKKLYEERFGWDGKTYEDWVK